MNCFEWNIDTGAFIYKFENLISFWVFRVRFYLYGMGDQHLFHINRIIIAYVLNGNHDISKEINQYLIIIESDFKTIYNIIYMYQTMNSNLRYNLDILYIVVLNYVF